MMGPTASGLPWRPIESALRIGDAFLMHGVHTAESARIADPRGQVQAGWAWYGILLWDRWREPFGWVFAKDGKPAWTEPTHWLELTPPDPQQLPPAFLPYPREVTPALHDALSTLPWELCGLAALMRGAGLGVRPGEDQPVALHRIVKLALAHGESWPERLKELQVELQRLGRERAIADREARGK